LASDQTPNPKFGVLVPVKATTATPAALKPLPTYFTKEDPLAENSLEGGPKIYEVGEETISNTQLLEELDINLELPPDKQQCLKQVLTLNEVAFGLDNRLGHLDAKVQIPLIPGSKPISLPLFPSSPVQ
jgi:hypothetical protein